MVHSTSCKLITASDVRYSRSGEGTAKQVPHELVGGMARANFPQVPAFPQGIGYKIAAPALRNMISKVFLLLQG